MSARFFVLRTPLLPFDEFLAWSDGLEAAAVLDDAARFEDAFAADCATLRDRLRAVVTRAAVRDALFVASPNIIERFHLWNAGPETERGRKVEHVLVRYFSRMAGRPTPFGLFAGCSVGALGEQTRLIIEGRDRYGRRTRLDTDYLHALADAITRDPALRGALTFRPNDSLYRAAGRLRYVESRLIDKARSYHLVAVEETDYLADTIERARAGATPAALAAALVEEDVSVDEARDYIAQLIGSQILVPDIALNISGPEPIHPLIEQLSEPAETREIAVTLKAVSTELAEVDRAGLGVEAESYLRVARSLESLPARVELSRLFQVDMTKPAPAATLGRAVLDEIRRGADVLRGLSAARPGDSLKLFREAFVARYEEREVPLVEALDEEVGIGFGTSDETSPLLRDLLFPSEPEEFVLRNKRRHELLLRKLAEACQRGAREIVLAPDELEAMSEKNVPPLPDAFAAVVRINAPSEAALDAGEFQLFIENIGGPSGANLLGRFCHTDELLYQHTLSHLRAEESLRPAAVFAEIVHLPEGRLGNIISRPVMRDYEIPYLGRSGASADRQLPVTDLYVSVHDERISLRSARLNREVIPRLTNAHNYVWNSPGVYKFLCMISRQGVAGSIEWDWGAFAAAPFLPRVTFGRLVLALARWRVGPDELRALGRQHGATLFRAIQKWRAARGLPRLVALADADNLLPIDLENALCVASFIQLVKERDGATLIELFPAPGQLCVRGPEGSYTHQLVVPFVRSSDERTVRSGQCVEGSRQEVESGNESLPPTAHCTLPTVQRRFPPGSEWLYVKLYTGTATVDALLRAAVRPLVESVMQMGAADRWFFLRYGDPDWHLRLRFHGEPERLYSEAWPRLQERIAPLLEEGRVWRVQLDTYEREVERYGGAEAILLAERLFHVDSEAALEIISMLEPDDAGADERWRLTVSGIDLLLADFGCQLDSRLALLRQVRAGFAREFRADAKLRGQLGDKFRQERRSLGVLLGAPGEEHPLWPGLEVLGRRSDKLAPVVAGLKNCEREGRLTRPLDEILLSYIHLHANRLLRSAQRQQELVIYDLLTRYYESQLFRAAGPRSEQ